MQYKNLFFRIQSINLIHQKQEQKIFLKHYLKQKQQTEVKKNKTSMKYKFIFYSISKQNHLMDFLMILIMQSQLLLVTKKVNELLMKYLFIRTYYFIQDKHHAIIMLKLIILMRLAQQKNLVVSINQNRHHQNDHRHQQ